MCLETITSFTTTKRIGYKVVEIYKNRIYPPCFYGTIFEVGKWVVDSNNRYIELGLPNKEISHYSPGFHIFLDKPVISNCWLLCKSNTALYTCAFDSVVAIGTDCTLPNHKIVVAKKIKLLKEIEYDAK